MLYAAVLNYITFLFMSPDFFSSSLNMWGLLNLQGIANCRWIVPWG